jgi:hypothetical protein
MVLGCLLWWGDAVEESEDALLESDWRVAMPDVSWALKESILGVGDLYVTLMTCGDGVLLTFTQAEKNCFG